MKRLVIVSALMSAVAAPSHATDPEHREKARAMIERSITWLRSQQGADGGWGVRPEAPVFPAITALVVNGMLLQKGADPEHDTALGRGVAFLLKYRKPDGGIYDQLLPSYNTSIAVSALARVGTPEAREAVMAGLDFLRTLQFGEGATVDGQVAKETGRVGREHAFYGGIGYGNHGRPDNSNLQFFLQAMEDAGVESSDPALQRALVFLQRTQMLDAVNDMPYADGSKQGGFIYSTSESGQKVGTGQSQAGTIEETLDDGTTVSRLRAYGSMTYAGFKSYVYADLARDDPRVTAAYDWIRRNYTVQENPGVGTDGLYYYYVTFARALDAWGSPTVGVVSEGEPNPRDWGNDLIDRLAEMQNADGSFKSVDDRWMESDPVLITAYSVIALSHAAR